MLSFDIISLVKDNRLTIQINKPKSKVFEFTTNPKNTPLWIFLSKKPAEAYIQWRHERELQAGISSKNTGAFFHAVIPD